MYRLLYQSLSDNALNSAIVAALKSYTWQNTIPFGTIVGSASNDAISALFGEKKIVTIAGISQIVTEVEIPLAFQVAGTLHSLMSIIFFFLISLAIRNFFRIG